MPGRYDHRTPRPYPLRMTGTRPSKGDPALMNLRQWPAQERPREKLLAFGVRTLSDAELLALRLGTSALRGRNIPDLAPGLLPPHRPLRELLEPARAPLLAHPAPPPP